MTLIFKKNKDIKIIAPRIETVKVSSKYGWYRVKGCQDGGFENILQPFSMAFWELVEE